MKEIPLDEFGDVLQLNGHTAMTEQSDTHKVLQRLLQTQKEVFARSKKEITFASPLVSIGESPVLYPNTIAVVSAKTGLHKSRLAEIIASSLLKRNQDESKCLGLIAHRECAVALIDTERNLSEQLPYAIQCISRLTHDDPYEPPENLYATSLLEESRENRFEAMRIFLETVKEMTKKHLVIILDVLTDICVNFNEPRYTSPLIDMLNSTINTADCTFVVVIHQNPSQFDSKARGHLGTEIENKASTIITLNTKDDSISIECKKQRSAKKFENIYARFDESRKTLVRLGMQEVEKLRATEEKHIDWQEVLGKETMLSRKELIDRLVKMEYVPSKATAERRIDEAKECEELIKGDGKQGKYSLPKMFPATEDLPFD